MKKITAIFICIAMMVLLFAVPASAAASNAISDGDFEKRDVWILPAEGEYVNEGVYNGTYALKMESEGNCFTHQSVYLVGGEKYEVSLYSKSGTNAKAYLKFEFYSPTGHVNSKTLEWENSKDWTKHTSEITIPQEANRAIVLIRLIGGGEIYYDDVSVYGEYSEENNAKENVKKNELKRLRDFYSIEPPIGTENLISNSSFEALNTTGTPASWNAYGGWNGAYARLEYGEAYSGDYCAKISTESGGNPHISTVVRGIEPGATYQLVMWYKGSVPDGNSKLSVKFEGYNSEGKNTYGINMYYLPDVKDWDVAVYNVIAPDDCTKMHIYPRCYSTSGTMYVDDISFYKIAEKKCFFFDTDQIFYYRDLEEGVARVKLNATLFDDGYTTDFYLKDGEQVLASANDVEFTNSMAEWTFPLSLLTELKKEYKVQMFGKTPQGEVIESEEIPVYIYERPKMMTGDGRFVVDGDVFVPSILYHITDENDWPKLHDAGINLLQTTAKGSVEKTREYLDKMHAAGLKAALVLYHGMKPAGDPSNIEYNRELVKGLKDHPALFCYMTMDEPFAHYGDKRHIELLLADGYKMIKEYDNVHPVYHCECIPERYGDAIKFVDVMGIDPYPSNLYSYETYVADMTASAKTFAQKYGKGIMQVLQVFTYGGINPDATRVHSMMYQSVMGGAAGNGFYTWLPDDEKLDPTLDKSQHWPVLTNFYDSEYDIVWGHYAGICDTVNLMSKRDFNLWVDVWAAEDGVYAAVLNRLANSQRVQIPFEYENITISDCNVSAVNHTLQAEVSDKSFSAVMPAGAAILFKITPGKVSGEAKLQINKMFNRSAAVVCPDNKTRLIVAGYKETAKGTVLADVSVASVSALGFASARLDSTLEYKEVKAFLWR